MAPVDIPSSSAAPVVELPKDFISIKDALDNRDIMPGQKIRCNIIGLVADFQPPIQTRGSDWKCTFSIIDFSTQHTHDTDIMKVNVFWPKEKMPNITESGQVVVIKKAMLQIYSGSISLLSNWASEFHLFPAKLPAWPITSSSGLPRPVSTSGQLTTDILRYIAWLQVHINREAIPDEDEFNDKAVNALKNIRQKYSLLKDIQDKKFYNLIGEVIRVFDNSGKISMYLSDYTENQHFYFQAYPLSENIGMLTRLSRDGDDYGYIKPKFNASNETKEWPGPYGKQAIQLSIYDQHALFVRERVKVGQWVKLRNVHVKFGSNGAHLEGFLRQDLGAHQDKIQVEVLTQAENPEMNDPNWKEAVRRKKQYWDKYKKQVKLLAEELKLDAKRKCEDEGEAVVKKPNRKMRRQEMMKQAEKKLTIREDNSATEQSPKPLPKSLKLNPSVRCNYQSQPTTSLSEILHSTRPVLKANDGTEFVAPFVNAKYRSCIRVVDYWPHKLEDFVVRRRKSEYEILSDYEGESSDTDDDVAESLKTRGAERELIWTWRFSLLVEDAGGEDLEKREKVWLMIDNESAQMLLHADATNLKEDRDALERLRQKLFVLWGDLEENKTNLLAQKTTKALLSIQAGDSVPSSPESSPEPSQSLSSPPRKLDDMPSDSDDETPAAKPKTNMTRKALQEKDPDSLTAIKKLNKQQAEERLRDIIAELNIKNLGFTACIEEYGVKVPEENESLANAFNGKRWRRTWRMFETTIA